MMSPNTKLREDVKFQQRWEFRRVDSEFDSSSNDSKSSSEPTLKKHKLVSSLVSVDNDEVSDTSRFQQEGNLDPDMSDQLKFGKGNRRKRGRSKKENVACNEKKKDSHRKVRQKKSKTSAYHPAAMDDLKKYMNSLLGDLKAARENLITWMREETEKLVTEEVASASERREDSSRGERLELQHQNNSEENAQFQYQNNHRKNTQVQPQNNLDKFGHTHQQRWFKENVHMQHIINSQENTEMQHAKNFQENIQLQHQNGFRSHTRAQTYNAQSSVRSNRSNKSAEAYNCNLAREDHIDYGRVIVPVMPAEQDREERFALSAKSNSKSSPSDLNVPVQQQKSIVLAIRAQNCSGRSSERSARGKKTSGSNNPCQVPEDKIDYSQAIGSLTAAEKDKGKGFGLTLEQKFSSDSSIEVASSMYLTLPTVLTKSHVQNHRLDTSSFNSIQPKVAANQIDINSERPSLILGSSSHHGYLQSLQPEERGRNFAQVSSRDISYFSPNSTTTSVIGSGFPVPLHHAVNGSFSIPGQVSLENLPRESNNILGLRLNGGPIMFSGVSSSLPEQYLANTFHGHSNYKSDGRLQAYPDGCPFPK